MSMEMAVCGSEPCNLMESAASCRSCLDDKNIDIMSCQPHQNLHRKSCEPQQNLDSKLHEPQQNLDRKLHEPQQNLDSKLYEPQQNVDSRLHEPQQNLDIKLHEPQHNLDSKLNEPLHNLDSKLHEPLQNLDSKLHEPQQNLHSKSCEARQNLERKLYELHQNLDSISFQPHQNLDYKSFQPHQNLDNELCHPYQNIDSKPCEPNVDVDSKPCVPYQNLDSTFCELNKNSGASPYEYDHNPLYSNPCQLHLSSASIPCPVNQNPESSVCEPSHSPEGDVCGPSQNPESDVCGPSQNQGCSSCKQGQCFECGSAQLSPHQSSWEDQVAKEVIQRWEREQSEYKEKLIVEDTPAITSWLSENSENEDAREFYIGGADISFVKGNNVDACSCLTIVRTSDLQVVYQRIEMIQLTQPYVPGYLAFREVQPLVDLYNQLRVAAPQYLPDVIMVDGNGVLHPRGFGLACHLGVVLGVPTLGVAKTLITAQGIQDDQDHKLKKQTLKQAGDFFDLVSDTGDILGRCVRTCDKAPNPIYISVGHRITLESVTQICLRCSKYRIPEPVRKADIDSREFLRQNKVEPYEFIQE